MATVTLIITQKSTPTGDQLCTVTPQGPLWIGRLLLVPDSTVGFGSARGNLFPKGSLGHPASRTICLHVDRTIFLRSAPPSFTITVTYDGVTGEVQQVGDPSPTVLPLDALQPITGHLSTLTDQGDQAEFVAQVLTWFATPADQTLLPVSGNAPSLTSKAAKKKDNDGATVS